MQTQKTCSSFQNLQNWIPAGGKAISCRTKIRVAAKKFSERKTQIFNGNWRTQSQKIFLGKKIAQPRQIVRGKNKSDQSFLNPYLSLQSLFGGRNQYINRWKWTWQRKFGLWSENQFSNLKKKTAS